MQKERKIENKNYNITCAYTYGTLFNFIHAYQPKISFISNINRNFFIEINNGMHDEKKKKIKFKNYSFRI